MDLWTEIEHAELELSVGPVLTLGMVITRDASLNTMYRVIFPNPIDKLQLHILGRGFKPNHSSFFSDCLEDRKKDTDYGYILVDYTPQAKDIMRVRSNIFPGEDNLVYMSEDQ